VPRTIEDTHNHVVWTKGRQTLDGDQALLYSRQRYGLPMGDVDRVKRQQAIVRGLMRSSLESLRSHSPGAIYDLLDALTENVTVDSDWEFGDMRDLVLDMRSMKVGDMQFLTAPVLGFGREGAQSVVYLDKAENRALWEAVREDKVARWAAGNPLDTLHGPAL